MKLNKKRLIKIVFGILSVFVILSMLLLFVGAEDNTMPEGYESFLGGIPDDTKELLPDNIYSEDVDKVADAVSEMSGVEYLLSAAIRCFGSSLGKIMPHVALLIGLIVLSSLGGLMSAHIGAGASRAFDICSRLVIFCAIGGVAISVLEDIKEFFLRISGIISAFIPLSATLYTMGGNVSAAFKSSSGLLVTLGIIEFISGVVVIPLFCFCLALSLVSGMTSDIWAGSIGGSVKKAFLTALGIITTILSLSLSSQTVIASKADSLAIKGAKMFLGSIPVTGGAVSSSLGTLASSVELIRGAVGVGGIIILLLLLLPVIIELWIMRSIYSLLGNLSGMLGMSGEHKLFLEISELYGILEGVAIMCSVVFFVAMGTLCAASPAIA